MLTSAVAWQTAITQYSMGTTTARKAVTLKPSMVDSSCTKEYRNAEGLVSNSTHNFLDNLRYTPTLALVTMLFHSLLSPALLILLVKESPNETLCSTMQIIYIPFLTTKVPFSYTFY